MNYRFQTRSKFIEQVLFTKLSLLPWVILLDTKKSVSYNLGGSCFDYFCKQIECGGDIHFERKWKRTLRKFFS